MAITCDIVTNFISTVFTTGIETDIPHIEVYFHLRSCSQCREAFKMHAQKLAAVAEATMLTMDPNDPKLALMRAVAIRYEAAYNTLMEQQGETG